MDNHADSLRQFQNHPLFQMLQELAKTPNPRFQIILVNGLLEVITNVIIKHHCKNHKKILNDSRTYPYSAQLLILNEIGVIKDPFYELLEYFRKLRNKAAHGGRFVITVNEINQFNRIFPKNIPEGAKLAYICNHLTFNYYNTNLQVLQPHFLSIAKEAK